MAKATQFTFGLEEVTTLLLKQQEIHEGKWMVAFEFQFGAGVIGPTPEEARPAAFAQVKSIQLVKQPDNAPIGPLVVDATIVNPAD